MKIQHISAAVAAASAIALSTMTLFVISLNGCNKNAGDKSSKNEAPAGWHLVWND